MKKLESSLKNMVIVLTGVTVVAGALLGYVNELTKGPIAEANAKALSDAIALVVPGFDNNPAEAPETIELNGATYKIYKATKGGEFIGAAVESSANGFGGALNVLVGFDKDGNIIDYSLLSHAETPGLGSKAADWFKKGKLYWIVVLEPCCLHTDYRISSRMRFVKCILCKVNHGVVNAICRFFHESILSLSF